MSTVLALSIDPVVPKPSGEWFRRVGETCENVRSVFVGPVSRCSGIRWDAPCGASSMVLSDQHALERSQGDGWPVFPCGLPGSNVSSFEGAAQEDVNYVYAGINIEHVSFQTRYLLTKSASKSKGA